MGEWKVGFITDEFGLEVERLTGALPTVIWILRQRRRAEDSKLPCSASDVRLRP